MTLGLLAGSPGAAFAEDCGCTTVGAYKNPASKDLAIDAAGNSPNNKYQVSVSGSSQVTVTVRKQSNNAQVFSTTLNASYNPHWGFSPDDDRFVYHYVFGGVHYVQLVDLTKTANQQIWSTAVATGSSRIKFSPHGKYLLYTALTGINFTSLDVVNATTGQVRYSSQFAFMNPPGSPGDSFGTANWGFSSDAADRSFVYGFVNGATSVSLNLVNLEKSSNRLVLSTNLTGPSAFWQFSPCGDMLGIVAQTSSSFIEARAVKTADGTTNGSAGGIPIGNATLSSTLAQHQVTVSGNISPLGPNNADAACAAALALDSVTVSPAAVTGGATNPTATVRLNQTGSLTVNLSSSDTGAATIPASTTLSNQQQKGVTITSKAVTVQKTVTITATAAGVTKTAQLTVNPPAAPATIASMSLSPATVVGGDASTGSVTLSANAPPGGTTVTLLSGDSHAAVPPNVTIPAGQSTGTFTIGTGTVNTQTVAPITARLNGADTVRNLTINSQSSGSGGGATRHDAACLANVLGPNDDGSTGVLGLPFTLNFFGTEYDALWLNNNGNVTFDSSLSTFTPFNLTSTNRVIVAPFFADVDTRGTGSGLVTWGTTTVGGRTAWCANWTGTTFDGVGYYSGHVDKKNTFQLLFIDRSDTGAGNFDIEFDYDKIQWETGDASGGSGGLGGSPARAGYSNGDNNAPDAAFELPGSAVSGALLDSAATGLTRNNRNAQELGRYVFPVRNGAPPTGGRINGRVLDPAGQPVSGARVQACQGVTCVNGRSNALGNYSTSGLPDGDYTLTAFPPEFTQFGSASIGPLTISGANTLNGQNIQLTGPHGPPSGTDIQPSSSGGLGVPTVYWGNPLVLTTHACPGGTATYEVKIAGTTVRTGTLAEGSPGTYSDTLPPFSPQHGLAEITINVDCPGSTPDESRSFNVYIDPSGNVRTVGGDPIEGATVTLYRSESSAGPFEVVPNGSAIMSAQNRSNPDHSDAAGHFGWDTIAGYYKVRAQKDGCVSPDDPTQDYVETEVLTIPPPVTNLDLRLDCPSVDAAPEPDTVAGRMVSNAVRGSARFASNVDCPADVANARSRPFTVTWGTSTFRMTRVSSVSCTDDGGFTAAPAPATLTFDTQIGEAAGTLNGAAGYTLAWRLEDHGAPSAADAARLKVTRDADGQVVLDLPLAALASGQNYAMPPS